MNLIDRWPGRQTGGGGDRFPAGEAKAAADALAGKIAAADRVVLLGRGVARAFGLHRAEFLEWTRICRDLDVLVAVAPHPSGVSRWWNEPANVERARAFWAALLRSPEQQDR